MPATRYRLVALRHEANLTQEEVAHRVRVSTRTVAAWESGATAPRRKNERRLAKALRVPAEDLQLRESRVVTDG